MQNNQSHQIPELKTPDGKPYDIPVEGSLGLLALGYVGLMTWRAKKIEAAKQMAIHQTKA
ncbi:MAG: hypothetical protein R3E32_25845 [Chitinophagales bacterium]